MRDTLRTDQRQWLIYEEEPVTAAVMATEVVALAVAGNLLARHRVVQLRALGNVMMKWSSARHDALGGEESTELEHMAASHAAEILDWIVGPEDTVPEQALDELHAALFGFDSKLSGAGVTGDAWYQKIARGEHGR